MARASTLLALARGRAATDLMITSGGRGVQMLLALVGNVVSARALGPVDFGSFGLVMAAVMICGTLADAGLTYTAVRFIAQHAEYDEPRAHAAARAYFVLRLFTGAVVAILGLLLSEPVAAGLLGRGELTPYLQLSFLTLFSLSISSYPGTVLVGLGSFGRLGLAGVLNTVITLAGILLLFAAGRLTLETLIVWNVVLPVVSTLPAWLFLPRRWLPVRPRGEERTPYLRRDTVRELSGFSKWMFVSAAGSIVALNGDLLLLGRLADPATVGVYSVALTLAQRFSTLNQSLSTVMLPRASRLRGREQIKSYSRRVLRGSLLLALLLGAAALLAQPLIALLYGERYAASAGLFLVLMLVVLFDLVTGSIFLVAFPLNRPRVLALSDWLRVGVLGAAGWLLIPPYSGYGAAAARFLSRLVGAAYTLLALLRGVNSLEDEEDPGPDTAAASWTS